MVFIKEKKGTFKKELGLLDLIVFGVGSTIGPGIFILIGLGANIAGPGLVFSFIIGTIIALFIALNYAELTSCMPSSGGSYAFVKEGFGGMTAFYVGWLIWLGSVVFTSLSAVGFILYLNFILPFTLHDLFSMIIILGFLALNIKGVKKAIKIQKIITLILLAILVVSIGFGFTGIEVENLSPFFPNGIPAVFLATSLIFVCFIGHAMLTTVSEETKEPKKIAFALITTVLISGLIYVLISFVTIGSVPIFDLVNSKVPLMELVKNNSIMSALILLAAILATLSSLNTSIIAASRNLFALSRDGYVPKIFSSLHKKYKTPHISMVFSSMIAILFVASRSIEFIAYVSSFSFLIAFSLVSTSLYVLRKKRRYLYRPFRLKHYKIFSLIGFILPLILLMFLEGGAIFTGIIWMIVGFFIYSLHTLGTDRFRMAFGGINGLVASFSFIIWYSLRIGFTSMEPFTKFFLSYTSLIIGFVCLFSGFLFIKRVKSPKKGGRIQI